MKYTDFEYIMSATCMNRYLLASNNNSKRAMTLYRKNLHLSQELFTIISCFEIAFRNAINHQYLHQYGSDWLRNATLIGGAFNTPNCRHAKEIINKATIKLADRYTHTKTQSMQYNQTFVFNQLEKINNLRNRIAHHEPICFLPNQSVIDTTYARQHYNLILQLFHWMNIDELSLLYGLDHITTVCNEIDEL
jgi:hypothetical protein